MHNRSRGIIGEQLGQLLDHGTHVLLPPDEVLFGADDRSILLRRGEGTGKRGQHHRRTAHDGSRLQQSSLPEKHFLLESFTFIFIGSHPSTHPALHRRFNRLQNRGRKPPPHSLSWESYTNIMEIQAFFQIFSGFFELGSNCYPLLRECLNSRVPKKITFFYQKPLGSRLNSVLYCLVS